MAQQETQQDLSGLGETLDAVEEVRDVAEEPSKQEAADAREDQVLMELDPDPPTKGPEPAEKAATGEPEEVDTDSEEPKASNEELADAYTVLRRDGFKPEDLEALGEETILRLAQHRAKSQADVDRLLREARAENASSEDEQTPEDSDAESTPAEAATDIPQRADLQQAAKQFADYLGLDEEGERLLAQSYSALIEPLQREVQELRVEGARADVERARAVLAEKYPQVADGEEENLMRVVNRMSKLYDQDNPVKTLDLMEEAIILEFRDVLKQEVTSAQKTIKRMQRNGHSSSPKRQKQQDRTLTAEQREDAVLELLESGDPDRLERARQMGGR